MSPGGANDVEQAPTRLNRDSAQITGRENELVRVCGPGGRIPCHFMPVICRHQRSVQGWPGPMKRRAAEGICGKRRGMPLMASHEGQASCRTDIDLPQQGAEDIPNDLGMIRQETGHTNRGARGRAGADVVLGSCGVRTAPFTSQMQCCQTAS